MRSLDNWASYYNNIVKEDEMGRARNTHEGDFIGKRQLGRYGYRWEDNASINV
jgi:hypothetical protein